MECSVSPPNSFLYSEKYNIYSERIRVWKNKTVFRFVYASLCVRSAMTGDTLVIFNFRCLVWICHLDWFACLDQYVTNTCNCYAVYKEGVQRRCSNFMWDVAMLYLCFCHIVICCVLPICFGKLEQIMRYQLCTTLNMFFIFM